MDNTKYIGMDVHKEAISIAVLNSSGKLVMECVIETKASSILQFFQGLRGSLHVTFEEGTWAAWLYDLLKPHVTKLVVCRIDWLRREETMKTAGRENQKRSRTFVATRDRGTEGESNPAQWGGLDGKKKSGRRRSVFFLTPFIELIGS